MLRLPLHVFALLCAVSAAAQARAQAALAMAQDEAIAAASQNSAPPADSRGWIMAEEVGTNPLRPTFRFVVRCVNGKVGHGPEMENRAEALDQAFAACAD